MVHGSQPVGMEQGSALFIGNGNDRYLGKRLEQRRQVRQVKTAVQSSEMWLKHPSRERKVKVVGMEVDYVERRGALYHFFQQQIVPYRGSRDPPVSRNACSRQKT